MLIFLFKFRALQAVIKSLTPVDGAKIVSRAPESLKVDSEGILPPELGYLSSSFHCGDIALGVLTPVGEPSPWAGSLCPSATSVGTEIGMKQKDM